MKLKLFAFVATSAFVIASCGKKDSGTTAPANAEKPTVTVSKTQIDAHGFDASEIVVKDKAGVDITASSTIYVNGVQMIGSSFSSESAGVFKIKASKSGGTSDEVTINAVTPTQIHTQKTIVEDYTGAWCGYCPRIAKALEDTYSANTNVIPVAVHNADAFAYSFEAQMRAKWGVQGFPTAVLNRDTKWSENGTLINAMNPYLNKWAIAGLAIESSVAGFNISGTVKTKFNVTAPNVPISIAIMLLENGKTLAQTNYYNTTAGSPFQGLGNPIPNFVHNHILRAASTSVFGDAIPQTNVVRGNEYSKTFSFNATGYDVTKCDIVAVLMYGDGQARKGVVNAQKVQAGSTKNYD